MRYAELRAIEEKLEPILGAGRTYDFGQTPANFYASPDLERTTTNCKDVGHEVLRHVRGVVLPPEIQIVEAYFGPDQPAKLFSRVNQTEQLRLGDWIMLGRPSATGPRSFIPQFNKNGQLENWDEFDVNHLAVYLGEFRGLEIVIHATPEADGAELTTLTSATRELRTSVIHGVVRANESELAA